MGVGSGVLNLIKKLHQIKKLRMKTIKLKNVEEMNFDQIFNQISPEEICDSFNLFTLVGKDFYAVTAGKKEHYNSMVGSGGGFGILMRKPTIWGGFRTDRYTLELIQKEQSYTLTFFPEEYKKQLLYLGSKSGRDYDKMKEVELSQICIWRNYPCLGKLTRPKKSLQVNT